VLQFRTMRDRGQLLADAIDISSQLLVLVYRALLEHFLVQLLALFELGAFAHQHEVGATGRVCRARHKQTSRSSKQAACEKRGHVKGELVHTTNAPGLATVEELLQLVAQATAGIRLDTGD